MKTLPPLETPWGQVEAVLPRDSRLQAREEAKRLAHPKTMDLYWDVQTHELTLKTSLRNLTFFSLQERMVISQSIYKSNHVEPAIYLIEDLDIDRKDGYLIRVVRRCKPKAESPLRYDLFAFTFMVRKSPPTLMLGDSEITDVERVDDLSLADAIRFMALLGLAASCTMCLGSKPVLVSAFHHHNQTYNKLSPIAGAA